MNKLHLLFASLCAAMFAGCTPEAVPTTAVETMKHIATYDGAIMSIYTIGTEQQSLLKDEFEAWQRAGVGGFDESFLKCPPTLLITGTTTNGVSYKIDFGRDRVTVNEVEGTLIDGTQYAREMTAADKRFRQFLLDCIAAGKLPRLARGRLPKSGE